MIGAEDEAMTVGVEEMIAIAVRINQEADRHRAVERIDSDQEVNRDRDHAADREEDMW